MPAITQKSVLPAFDRRFYGCSAITVALIVLVGFARTYYLKGFFGTRTLAPFVHFHGLVMSAWVVLFFVQTRLIAAHRFALHRSLGILGCCLAAVVAAIVWRKRSDYHKRLMLLATVNLLAPAVARICLIFTHNQYVQLAAFFLCIPLCVAVDTARHRRLHPAKAR